MNDDLLTLATAAAIAGCNASTLRYAIANGRLTAVKFGKTWLITRPALDAWLAADVHKPGVKRKT